MFTHVHFPVMCVIWWKGGGGPHVFSDFVWPIMPSYVQRTVHVNSPLHFFVPLCPHGTFKEWADHSVEQYWFTTWTLTPHLSPISGADLRSSMHTGRGMKASTSTARLGGGGVPLPLCAI